MFLLALTLLGAPAGCASMSGTGNLPLKQTRNDVDWAMVRYHNRVTFGFITPTQQEQVSAAYKAYQTAFNAAAAQAHSNYAAPTPDNVKELADQLLSVLSAIP
jgi:hypothetical protein